MVKATEKYFREFDGTETSDIYLAQQIFPHLLYHFQYLKGFPLIIIYYYYCY